MPGTMTLSVRAEGRTEEVVLLCDRFDVVMEFPDVDRRIYDLSGATRGEVTVPIHWACGGLALFFEALAARRTLGMLYRSLMGDRRN